MTTKLTGNNSSNPFAPRIRKATGRQMDRKNPIYSNKLPGFTLGTLPKCR